MTATALDDSPRERILKTASELFYAEGIRAVGVDTIIAKAEVAKASFYKHFPSKDDLVMAFLQRRDEFHRRWLKETVERLSPNPAGRPLAIFDALAERFASPDYRGCAFINSGAELKYSHPTLQQTVFEHKRLVTEYIVELMTAAGIADADELAREFVLLMDGAFVTALRERSPRAAQSAKHIATALLRDATAGKSIRR